jgi:ZIP family zinc transporter
VLGIGLLGGGGVSLSVLAAVFISNVPEGLSSAAGMKAKGRSARYVFGVWGGIAVISALASLAGYAVFSRFSADVIAATTAVAAGAILSMLADTMMPEAFEQAHDWAGVITVAGFLSAFVLSKLSGA